VKGVGLIPGSLTIPRVAKHPRVTHPARWLLVAKQTIHPAGGQVQYRLRALLDTEADTDTGAHTDS